MAPLPTIGTVAYLDRLGEVVVVDVAPMGHVYVRPKGKMNRCLVHAASLRSQPAIQEQRAPNIQKPRAPKVKPREVRLKEVRRAFRHIDADAVEDVVREARDSVQRRPRRGGGSFESSRKRH